MDSFQRRRSVAGFVVAVVRKYGDDRAGQYAGLLAYYAFLSTFPLLLVLVSVLGIALGGNTELQRRVLDSSLAEFPVIGDQLRANVHSLDRSGAALAVGLAVAFVGARGLADTAQNAFNAIWEVPYVRRPGFPESLLRSLFLLILIGVGAASTGWVAVVIADGSKSLWQRLLLGGAGLAFNAALFVAGFRLATANVVSTRQLALGAVIAATAWQALLAAGGLLVAHSLRGTSQSTVCSQQSSVCWPGSHCKHRSRCTRSRWMLCGPGLCGPVV
jgi:membrane protein